MESAQGGSLGGENNMAPEAGSIRGSQSRSFSQSIVIPEQQQFVAGSRQTAAQLPEYTESANNPSMRQSWARNHLTLSNQVTSNERNRISSTEGDYGYPYQSRPASGRSTSTSEYLRNLKLSQNSGNVTPIEDDFVRQPTDQLLGSPSDAGGQANQTNAGRRDTNVATNYGRASQSSGSSLRTSVSQASPKISICDSLGAAIVGGLLVGGTMAGVGAKIGALGGTIVLPGIGTVAGATFGLVLGGVVGFIGGFCASLHGHYTGRKRGLARWEAEQMLAHEPAPQQHQSRQVISDSNNSANNSQNNSQNNSPSKPPIGESIVDWARDTPRPVSNDLQPNARQPAKPSSLHELAEEEVPANPYQSPNQINQARWQNILASETKARAWQERNFPSEQPGSIDDREVRGDLDNASAFLELAKTGKIDSPGSGLYLQSLSQRTYENGRDLLMMLQHPDKVSVHYLANTTSDLVNNTINYAAALNGGQVGPKEFEETLQSVLTSVQGVDSARLRTQDLLKPGSAARVLHLTADRLVGDVEDLDPRYRQSVQLYQTALKRGLQTLTGDLQSSDDSQSADRKQETVEDKLHNVERLHQKNQKDRLKKRERAQDSAQFPAACDALLNGIPQVLPATYVLWRSASAAK